MKFSCGTKKKLYFPRGEKNQGLEWLNDQWTFSRKKITGNFSLRLKISEKNHWFVTGTFCFVTGTNQKLSRAVLQNFRNCHGHFLFLTGIFVAFLSRVAYQFSREKFGVFCHGHFFKIKGTLSKSVPAKPKIVPWKKKKKKKHWINVHYRYKQNWSAKVPKANF